MKQIFNRLLFISDDAGQTLFERILNVLIMIVAYILITLLLIWLVTLVAFGYVPVEDGGVTNPLGTIEYVWGNGILFVTLPLALLSLAGNTYIAIKAKQKVMWYMLGAYAICLAIINVGAGLLDVVALLAPWFAFL